MDVREFVFTFSYVWPRFCYALLRFCYIFLCFGFFLLRVCYVFLRFALFFVMFGYVLATFDYVLLCFCYICVCYVFQRFCHAFAMVSYILPRFCLVFPGCRPVRPPPCLNAQAVLEAWHQTHHREPCETDRAVPRTLCTGRNTLARYKPHILGKLIRLIYRGGTQTPNFIRDLLSECLRDS